MKKLAVLCLLVGFAVLGGGRAVADGPDALADGPDRKKLEKEFAEKLSGSKLVGYWNLWGKEKDVKEDAYTIDSVTKLDKPDLWRFVARIEFGKVDVKVPINVQVKWAGDTPVITVDKVGIPGVGTYSARLLIQGDRYAATWDGGDHGGYMWGKVEKIKKKE